MSEDKILVRSAKGGVVMTPPKAAWHVQRDALILRVQTQERFFKGGRIAVDLGDTDWTERQLEELMQDMADEGVCLWAVLSTSANTLAAAEVFCIPTRIGGESPSAAPTAEERKPEGSILQWLNRDVAEGEVLEVDGNLVLCGDIAQGAVVRVNGSLLIWGTSHGTIYAACDGGEDAKIQLLNYSEGLIYLNGQLLDLGRKGKQPNAYEIFQQDGQIKVKAIRDKKLKNL